MLRHEGTFPIAGAEGYFQSSTRDLMIYLRATLTIEKKLYRVSFCVRRQQAGNWVRAVERNALVMNADELAKIVYNSKHPDLRRQTPSLGAINRCLKAVRSAWNEHAAAHPDIWHTVLRRHAEQRLYVKTTEHALAQEQVKVLAGEMALLQRIVDSADPSEEWKTVEIEYAKLMGDDEV